MSAGSPGTDDGLASGASSMRESAKWLMGGVSATAAGVFAGSSLTNLGSLDFVDQPLRLSLAIGGAIVGFFALGWITRRAVGVLRVETVTFRVLAEVAELPDENELKALAEKMVGKHTLPLGAASLADVIARSAALPAGDSRIETVGKFVARVSRHAAFLRVRGQFDRLTKILFPATALALLGFGLFAWAANPPDAAGQSRAAKAPAVFVISAERPGS